MGVGHRALGGRLAHCYSLAVGVARRSDNVGGATWLSSMGPSPHRGTHLNGRIGGAVSISTQTPDDGPSILHNAGWLMAMQLVTWSMASVQAVILPRYFGVATAGRFYIALSLWALAGLIISFGTDVTITRRVARCGDNLEELVGGALLGRWVLYVVGFAVLVGTPWQSGTRPRS